MMRSRSSCNLTTMLFIWASFIAAAASMAAEGPRVFKVGDDFGWRVPLQNDTTVYTHWASTNRFHIGDSLSFVYDKGDSVMEVDKWGFYHCNGSDAIIVFDNGNSTLKLDRPGLFYFISGSNAHCTNGQRLILEVMHIHHHQHNIASMPPSMSPLSDSGSGSPSASDASGGSGSGSGSGSTSDASSSTLLPTFSAAAALFLLALFCCQP